MSVLLLQEDVAIGCGDNYVEKVSFNDRAVDLQTESFAESLEGLGQDGWKIINAQTVGIESDHCQEVYCNKVTE